MNEDTSSPGAKFIRDFSEALKASGKRIIIEEYVDAPRDLPEEPRTLPGGHTHGYVFPKLEFAKKSDCPMCEAGHEPTKPALPIIIVTMGAKSMIAATAILERYKQGKCHMLVYGSDGDMNLFVAPGHESPFERMRREKVLMPNPVVEMDFTLTESKLDMILGMQEHTAPSLEETFASLAMHFDGPLKAMPSLTDAIKRLEHEKQDLQKKLLARPLKTPHAERAKPNQPFYARFYKDRKGKNKRH